MAQFVSFGLVIISVLVLAWQIFFVEGCPARCVKNGGTCSFLEPTKCCTPICLAQYQVCGKTCAAPNAACVLSNDCCVPLACQNNVCCSAVGSTCAVTSDCCSPLSCANNVCCSAVSSTCALTSDCCSPLSCEKNLCCTPSAIAPIDGNCCSGIIRPEVNLCCSDFGATCSSKSGCCSRVCDASTNTCVCNPSGNPVEDPYTYCCTGFYRPDLNVCCSLPGASCVSNTECCFDQCVLGQCV